MNVVVCWAFGIGGVLANFIIYQQKNRRALLTAKLMADILWTAHYSLLGAWSGAAVCGIGILAGNSVFKQAPEMGGQQTVACILFPA